MNGRMLVLAVVLAGLMLTGCETYRPYNSHGFDPSKLQRVAILEDAHSKTAQHIASDIDVALSKRGIYTTIVSDEMGAPKDVDGYFTFESHWQWDLTMYLADLEIELHEPQTARVLASAHYQQGWIHRYPDRSEIVDALIAQIFGEPPPQVRHQPDNSK
jgi:hypothetical protein